MIYLLNVVLVILSGQMGIYEEHSNDCSNKANYVQDWLVDHGFDAHLRYGANETDPSIAHMWVVVDYEDEEYFIEATTGHVVPEEDFARYDRVIDIHPDLEREFAYTVGWNYEQEFGYDNS